MDKQENNMDFENLASNQGAQGVFNAPVSTNSNAHHTHQANEGLLTKTRAIFGITAALIIIITILGLRSMISTNNPSESFANINPPSENNISGPQEVLLQFLEAVNIDDISTIDGLSSREGNNQMSSRVNALTKTQLCPEPEIVETKMSGSTARIFVDCHYSGSGALKAMYILIREGGEWKVHSLNWAK